MKRKIIITFVIVIGLFISLYGTGTKAAVSDYEGRILLDVERHGEAYYIYQGQKYYLGRPSQAFEIMKNLSLGISEENFNSGFKQVNDIWQIYRIIDSRLFPHIQGRIVLRPQSHGEAYYVTPGLAAGNGYQAEYLDRPADAFRIMTKYGLGARSAFIDSIPTGTIDSSPCVPGVDPGCTSSGELNIISVSDTSLINGQSISISGSDFGSKSNASPLVWDNFEDGSVGSTIKNTKPIIGPAWSVWTNGGDPLYGNTSNRDNSTKNAFFNYSASAGYTKFLQYYTDVDSVYFTFWWRFDQTSSQRTANIKPWMEFGNQGNCPGIYSGFGAPPDDNYLRASVVDCDANGTGYQLNENMYDWYSYNTRIDEIDGQWVRMELFLEQSSTPGVADGSYHMWVHQPNGNGINLDIEANNIVTRDTVNEWYQWWILGSYQTADERSPLAVGEIRGDDIYFDSTQARIEIGDTANWSTNTHREIQVASAWSDTGTTFTVNQGSFADGAKAYLFVVDADGNASSGYPISF
ncbi:MAG: hypothetical protein WCW66_06265 [Patescibacteria group bacterium]